MGGHISLPDNIEEDAFTHTGEHYEEHGGSFGGQPETVHTTFPLQQPLDRGHPNCFHGSYSSLSDLSQLPTDYTDLSVSASPFVPPAYFSPEDVFELTDLENNNSSATENMFSHGRVLGGFCDDEEEDFSKLLGELSVQS